MRRLVLLVVLAACNKTSTATTTPESPSGVVLRDPLDQSATMLLEDLAEGDYEGLRSKTVQPLTHDLSRAEFDDLAAIVQWLGPLQSRETTDTDMSRGAGTRRFALTFQNGSDVELEVSLDESEKLIGFQFGGEGYTEAERGVLAEPWREFKVYDFALLDAEGNALPEDTPIKGKRVDYEVVVGGIEALLGAHHLAIEKIVLDASGKEIFHEPIEYDTKFAQDATGIPRGVVRGHIEVPGPGTWELDLKIADENSHRDIGYRHKFETTD